MRFQFLNFLTELYNILDRLSRHYFLCVENRAFTVIILPVFNLNPRAHRYPLSGFQIAGILGFADISQMCIRDRPRYWSRLWNR